MKCPQPILVHTSAELKTDVARSVEVSMRTASDDRPLTVGLWDLGAWLAGLTALAESLNRIQDKFTFLEVKATVPPGIISRPERVVAWAVNALGRNLRSSERREIENNVIANEFLGLAERIRKDLRIDYILGITPSMVAGEDDEEIYWNHFSTFEKRSILASTYDLRRFAKQTRRPFEAFLGGIIVSQTLVARFFPKLGYHEDRGCLFDYNESRDSIKEMAANPRIESECMMCIAKPYRDAAQAFVDFLRTYGKR